MRKDWVNLGVAALLVLTAAAVDSGAVETRTFTGTGSRGVGSDVEFFIVGGTYEHRLRIADGCFATAGVFPSERLPRVKLGEVLSADLSADSTGSALRRTSPSGSFAISTSGWATLQLGTGPDCSWTYSIRGRFLPPGDEPGPPRAPGLQWWEGLLLVVGTLLVIGLVVRRGISAGEVDHEERVRALPTRSNDG